MSKKLFVGQLLLRIELVNGQGLLEGLLVVRTDQVIDNRLVFLFLLREKLVVLTAMLFVVVSLKLS